MTWEPKQGDLVFYTNSKGVRKDAIFIATYNDKYVIDAGDIFSVDSIERLVIEKEPEIIEPEITVGSVWEKDEKLYVVVSVNSDEVYVFCPEINETGCYIDMDHFTPRPDKIGMAPVLWKNKCDGYSISDALYGCEANARKDYGDSFASWPANNSMWVIP